MVSVCTGSIGLGYSSGCGHCVVLWGKIPKSHSATLHPNSINKTWQIVAGTRQNAEETCDGLATHPREGGGEGKCGGGGDIPSHFP